jgi:hypothetical protein
METASVFARKHGLERFLDDPGLLNDMILRLLVLQELMQNEAARRRPHDGGEGDIIAVRRAAGGAFTALCAGDAAYRYAVVTALRAATATVPLFQRGRFRDLLREMGVPDGAIGGYCSTIQISDDTHCIDPE